MKLMLLFLFSLFLKGLLHQQNACLGFFDDLVLYAKLCAPGVKDQVVAGACKGGGKGTLPCLGGGSFQGSNNRSRQVNSLGVRICTVERPFCSTVPQFSHL